MGSRPSTTPIAHFDPSEWQQLASLPRNYHPDYGQYLSYRHSLSQEFVDQYFLTFSTEEEERNYYECALQRMREDYIVNTVHYENKSLKHICSSSYQSEIYIQHIEMRLSDITGIPYPENIYLLSNSLHGFRELFRITGYFEPHEDLFCIDSYGEAKVWMNPDLSKNYPVDITPTTLNKTENEMVIQIIEIVEDNTDQETVPETVLAFLKRKGKKYPNFQEALDLLDEYIRIHQVVVPQYCQLILEIYKDVDNEEKSKSQEVSVLSEDNKSVNISEEKSIFHEEKRIQKKNQSTLRQSLRKQKRKSTHSNSNSIFQSNTFNFHEQAILHPSHEKDEKRSQISSQKSMKKSICFTYNPKKDIEFASNSKRTQKFTYSLGKGELMNELDPEIAADLFAFLN